MARMQRNRVATGLLATPKPGEGGWPVFRPGFKARKVPTISE